MAAAHGCVGRGHDRLGFAFGWWLIVLGAFLLLASAVGFVFEYYRGYHAEG